MRSTCFHLIYSLIMVAMSVEIMHQPAPVSAADAVMIRTVEPAALRSPSGQKGQTMSLLTITKLTESVGAEVTGLDPARLASDDSIGEAILDALEDNGVLVFRGL